MTDITIDKQPARRSDFSRLFTVLRNPTATFTEMISEARPTWLTPMLVLSLTAVLVVIVSGYLKTQAAMMGEVPLPPDWQYWSPDMQESYMQAQQTTQSPAVMYVFPLVGALLSLWVGWVLVAGLLHLGSTILGGRGSMQSALNIVAWASLPFALRNVVQFLFMLFAGHTIINQGLSGFASSAFLSQALARVDLYWIWYMILLVIGFAIADGLPRSKAFVGVAVVLLLVLTAQAGVSSLTSNLGGQGQSSQLPFM